MRYSLLYKWREIGYTSSQFGIHSLRGNEASAAANEGIADKLFKWHSHEQSESAKDEYVKDSEEVFMSVSRSLKLWQVLHLTFGIYSSAY